MLVAITAVTCGSPTSLGPARPVAEIGSAEAFQCQVPQQVDRPTPAVDRPTPGTVPLDFVPAAAVTCEVGDAIMPVAGVAYSEHRWEGDFSTLISLLNAPSRRVLTPGMCPTYSVVETPQLWLVDARGRAVEPTLPVDECGLPDVSAIAEIRNLNLVTEFDHRVPIINPQRLRVSSCSPHFSPPDEGTESAVGLTVGYVFCLFDGTVNVGVTDEIGISIEDLPPAGPCSISATQTATTTYVDAWPSNIRNVTVELDGCRRVVPDGYAPLQASEELLAQFW